MSSSALSTLKRHTGLRSFTNTWRISGQNSGACHRLTRRLSDERPSHGWQLDFALAARLIRGQIPAKAEAGSMRQITGIARARNWRTTCNSLPNFSYLYRRSSLSPAELCAWPVCVVSSAKRCSHGQNSHLLDTNRTSQNHHVRLNGSSSKSSLALAFLRPLDVDPLLALPGVSSSSSSSESPSTCISRFSLG